MTLTEFHKDKPVLYGQVNVNGKSKIGSFKYGWNSFANTGAYNYHTITGRKGKGGFTINRAYALFTAGKLSINPVNADPKNYL